MEELTLNKKVKIWNKQTVASIADSLKSQLLEFAAIIFATLPALQSFGWFQFDTTQLNIEPAEYHSTVLQPNINGNDGRELHGTSVVTQIYIAEILQEIDPSLLLIAFGNNVEVCVYRDLSIEINNYAPYEFALSEFPESSES